MKIHLIPEGLLEEIVGKKLIEHCGHQLGTIYNKGSGCAYIKEKAHRYYSLAKGDEGVLVLTDFRDSKEPCIPQALQTYISINLSPVPPAFLCRFAVQELECWLMADRIGLGKFLSIAVSNISQTPETINLPKQELVNLARKSNKKIKEDIVPDQNHGGPVAPLYTTAMSKYISDFWDIERACQYSQSLKRCVTRLKELFTIVTP